MARLYTLGPVSLLIVGRVWSLDVLRWGVFGIGRRVAFRRLVA